MILVSDLSVESLKEIEVLCKNSTFHCDISVMAIIGFGAQNTWPPWTFLVFEWLFCLNFLLGNFKHKKFDSNDTSCFLNDSSLSGKGIGSVRPNYTFALGPFALQVVRPDY